MDDASLMQRTDKPAGNSEDLRPPFSIERRFSEQAVSKIACIPHLFPSNFASIKTPARVNRGSDHRRRQYPALLELGGEQQLVKRPGHAESEKAIAGQRCQQSAVSQLSDNPARTPRPPRTRDDVERSASLERHDLIVICRVVDQSTGSLDGVTQEIVSIVTNDDMATGDSCDGVTGNRG
jgi:hypothetical protein